MKTNGNNLNKGNYYIGLDVGTNSVGWAVADENYNILKFKGNAMWGVRLFEEAQDASARRTSRTARRRLARRNQRLMLLQLLFAEEISKIDKDFFKRLNESALHSEDKNHVCFTLFADKGFTDKDYHRKYPTIYHLRNELANSKEEHDVRLVYLALHHIIKHRGHFLYETSDTGDSIITAAAALSQLWEHIEREYGISVSVADEYLFVGTLERSDIGITAKKKLLREAMGCQNEQHEGLNIFSVCDMLSGAVVNFADLFCNDEYKNAELKNFSLKNNLDDNFDAITAVLGEKSELLVQLKAVYDAAKLSQVLGGNASISQAKIALYEKNYKDLRILKKYVRENAPEKYKKIFYKGADKCNYAAYSRYDSASGDYVCKQEDFCKFLKKELPQPSDADTEMLRIFREIQDITFLSRLKGADNGVIPYQLHRQELVRILENASVYLDFLNAKDADDLSVKEKIIKTFEFRVPYYVGPVNKAAKHCWAVRFAGKENEKIYPWNFDEIIDTEVSAAGFIENLIGLCTYTGEKVLPKDSLLYSEYAMLNEMNLLRVNGKPLPQNVKADLIRFFFYDSRRKVTKKQIKNHLLSENLISATDEISGIDDTIKSSLRSYHDFKVILDKTGDYSMVESIIRSILVFGEDKAMLRRWLKKNTYGLDDADVKHICRLKYSDWGRLSETFLTGIYSPDEKGSDKCVMDYLRETDCNLMQLMSDKYKFAEKSREHREMLTGSGQSLSEKLDSMYIAPAVRRSIRQTLRIVDEIVDIRKSAPSKIFIEMARDNSNDLKNKRTESRKTKLLELYKSCKEDSNILFAKLENEDENRLRSDKLYLYYLQLGKCMYSGEPIDFESLVKGELYDIDHIFPQSKIKDNSLDNRVLVKNVLNREKTNIYPISEDIREKMLPMWTHMKKAGLISQKKFDRLSRSYPLTDKELSDFVARQLTETQQATKALAQLLKNEYESSRIVYSKAGNVSDFRHDFDMIKCRDVNDLHHAKDAYLNIVVGNVYDTKFTDRFFANIHRENYSLNKVFAFDTPGAWNKEESIKIVKKYMSKNNILFTRMPHEVKGQLFEVQPKTAGKGQINRKKNLDLNKYGGYGSLSTTYFFAVNYLKGKKRVTSLRPLPYVEKQEFLTSPTTYCEKKLGLNSPHIIMDKILKDSLLEVDGIRMVLSAKHDKTRLSVKNANQLIIDYPRTKYVKNVSKYVERCTSQKKDLPITEHDNLSYTENLALYDYFIEKLKQKTYSRLLERVKSNVVLYRDAFCELTLHEQCKILLEILKAFSCGSINPNLTALGGPNSIKPKELSMDLSNYQKVYLINQSPTGLFETKVDLLG